MSDRFGRDFSEYEWATYELMKRLAEALERIAAIQEWVILEMKKHHPDEPATEATPRTS